MVGTRVRRLSYVLVAVATATALLAAAPAAQAAAAPTDGIELEVVVSGAGFPIDLDAPVGDDRVFIAYKNGVVRVWEDGALLPTPFLDISSSVLDSGEQGLLGLAFHPDYENNGLFYVDYSETGTRDSIVAEYEVSSGNPNVADPSTRRELLRVDQPQTNHNGGAIAFGKDGYLYVALGDGGGGGDDDNHGPIGNGQNTSTLLGSILRIDAATGAAPADNPFVGAPGSDEIWAYGMRNPWRMSFDPVTGDLYIGDVGQGTREEIDVIPAGEGGLNFGWRIEEGSFCHRNEGVGCGSPTLTGPVHEYGRSTGRSVTGGYVYRGNALPHLRGHYFYSDFGTSFIKSFRVVNGNAVDHTDYTAALSPPPAIVSFGTDGFGELYVLNTSAVYKLVPSNPATCDVNGDGFSDSPVGAPGEDRSGAVDAGIAHVMRGSGSGLDPDAGSFLTGAAQADLQFGSAFACADFDGDGFDDVAVGAPGADVNGRNEAGTVYVAYGSAGGLGSLEEWNQDSPGIGGSAKGGDRLGAALAAGDFDRDGKADLAIGAPGKDAPGFVDSGMVLVIYGSGGGLTSAGRQLWRQGDTDVLDAAEKLDAFGEALATGDLDGDGFADLVVGVPGEGVTGVKRAGAVHVFFGSKSGVSTRDKVIHRDTPGIRGELRQKARFGSAVAVGAIDADGFDDLVVGVPQHGGGQIAIIYGGPKGPSKRDQKLRQGLSGIPGSSNRGDDFGSAVAVGDLDADGFADVVASAPGDTVGGQAAAGSMVVIPGAKRRVATASAARWHRNTAGIDGVAASDDGFGAALRIGDFDGDGFADVAVGVPQTAAGGVGEITVLYGAGSGVAAAGSQRLDQGDTGQDPAENGDRFGAAL